MKTEGSTVKSAAVNQEKGPALLECTGSVAGSHSSRPGAGSVLRGG